MTGKILSQLGIVTKSCNIKYQHENANIAQILGIFSISYFKKIENIYFEIAFIIVTFLFFQFNKNFNYKFQRNVLI